MPSRQPMRNVPLLLLIAGLAGAGCALKAPLDPAVAEARPSLEVAELTLRGVEAIDEGRLRAVLETQSSSWWPWAEDHLLDRAALAADLSRIVAYYADHGYPEARVVSHDVAIDRDDREASITIRVHEGEPVRLAEIVLAGFDALNETERRSLREQMPLAPGLPVEYVDIVASAEMAVNALKDRGYPYAQVRVDESLVEPRERRVRLTADPGPQAWFGDIEITGNRSVDDEIIRRELAYRPGELFARHLLQESQRRLYRIGLFRFANLEPVDIDAQPAEVKTRVTVAEAKHTQVQVSAGYGTEEKLRGGVTWRNLNFLGGARTLGAHLAWSSLNRGAQLDFVQPYLLHPRLSLQVDGHYWKNTEPAYDLTTRGGSAQLNGEIDDASRWSVSLVGEDHRSQVSAAALADPSLRDELIALGLDPETGRQGGLLTALAVRAERDTAQNPLDPQQGYQVAVHLEQAGNWLPGAFDYVEWQVGGRYYRPVGSRVVLAARTQVATIDPANTSAELPFAQRYFLGGSTSLRGWGRYEVSPLSSTGLPLGGKSMLDSSLELRARIKGNLGTALFIDAGNVWRDEWQFDLADLRADTGAGVRYRTPIGPVRFDVAWQLTPIEGLRTGGEARTRRWRVHFSIGQAF